MCFVKIEAMLKEKMGKQNMNAQKTSKISGRTGRGRGSGKGKKNLISNYYIQQQQEKEKRREVEELNNDEWEDIDEEKQNNNFEAHSQQSINKPNTNDQIENQNMNQHEKLTLKATTEESKEAKVDLEKGQEENESQDNVQEPSTNENEEAQSAHQTQESEEPNEEPDTDIKLLIAKWHKIQEEGDDQDLVIDTTRLITEMVLSWLERNIITGAKAYGDQGEEKDRVEKLDDHNQWLSEPKKQGTNAIKLEFFFTVCAKHTFQDTLEEEIDYLKAKKIRIDIKRTKDEHTNKVGFLAGPVVSNANMPWYDAMLKYSGKIDENNALEVRKDAVREGQEIKQWCIAVHSARSTVDEVDYKLRVMSAQENSHVKCVSFKNSAKAERVAALKLNEMVNTKLKYEWIEDAWILDKGQFKGKAATASEIIMKAKDNGAPIFTGLEQGRGTYSNRVYSYFKPSMQEEAQTWLRNYYGKEFKIDGKDEYNMSVRKRSAEDEKLNNVVTDQILERLKEMQIDASTKRSYSQVIQGHKENKESIEELSNEDNITYQYGNVASDDETCFTDNRSIESAESDDAITDKSTYTDQTKVIVDLQKTMKMLEAQQQKFLDHIDKLEESLATVSTADKESLECKAAIKYGKKVQKKRKAEDQKRDEQHQINEHVNGICKQ